ncbi:MAG: helix-turn-helix transcriptional regulator [Verrucomicrobia bacterium]|nr:helix-turn-helix transcriptional regulator [Verrucomicrobiota bacterium]MCH8511905.1 helix-turn-helix transcriptional regulator [Kiritimatiellia bacterium]
MAKNQQPLWQYNTFQTSLLFCYEGKVPDTGRGRKNMANAAAWLIRSGWARVEREDGTVTEAGPGQWLMVRPGKRRQRFAPDTELLSINFRASLHNEEQLFERGLSRVLEASGHPDLERAAMDLVREVSARFGKEGSIHVHNADTDISGYLAVQRRLMRWVEVWAHALLSEGLHPTLGNLEDSRVLEAITFLRQRRGGTYSQGSEAAAARVGLSLAQLNRLFRQETGGTLRKYHTQLTRERAYDLLMHTDHTIQEIGADLGFHHASHFTLWFKKQCGVPPGAFREKSTKHRYFTLR